MNGLFAGVDLGGTAIKAALADPTGAVVAEEQIPTQSHLGPEKVVERIAELVERLALRAGLPLAALGMGVPGLVDRIAGVTKFLPNLPTQWREIPAGPILSERLRVPVRLLNDVRTATLGELTFGHGAVKGLDGQPAPITMAFFSIGTGIGGGVAVEGRLRLGIFGAAGELGHQTILPDGPLCGCGNRGCLETLASGPALVAEGVRLLRSGLAPRLHALTNGDANEITPKTMADAARTGDEAVRQALLRAADYLGIGVANTVVTLHPDLVVLGGGVAEIGSLLIERVREVVLRRVGMFPPDDVRIEPSLLGERAGVLGAVALARQAAEA